MYQKIPVRCDLPAYDLSITLENTLYYLSFEWNERGNFWSMDILDQDQNYLVCGVRMVTNIDLLVRHKNPSLPKGVFMLLDTSGKNLDPNADNFGLTVLLFYRESITVDA